MPRKKNVVENALTKKGFRALESHHTMLFFYDENGRRTSIKTKVSHGHKEISDPILGQMARQCKLARRDFLNLIDCSLSQSGYEEILKKNNELIL